MVRMTRREWKEYEKNHPRPGRKKNKGYGHPIRFHGTPEEQKALIGRLKQGIKDADNYIQDQIRDMEKMREAIREFRGDG